MSNGRKGEHPLMLLVDIALAATLIYQFVQILKQPPPANGPGNTTAKR